ncbi:MAG: leucyl/phenylalanyl-tRNA--protein transferase [Bacteroidota bacterium]
MPFYWLDERIAFPDPELAESDGLLAVGGDLTVERLLLAYQMGIFPWYSHPDPILWWAPDPRFVMLPEDIKVARSMRPILNQRRFHITYDQDFESVIDNCQQAPRAGQRDGTWITPEMRAAYLRLHGLGLAHSVEAWQDGELVGGLYGVSLGSVFFGESMFAKRSNASKAAFITLVRDLQVANFTLIDAQIRTSHLESLGAKLIPRRHFNQQLNEGLEKKTIRGDWGSYFQKDQNLE